ncbi:MAG: SAM-dependent methyltransferase [Thermoanaerobaculia bacterium]
MNRSGLPRPDRFGFLDRRLEETFRIGDLMEPTGVPEDDVGLRFYIEVLGLRHLHYGLWDSSDPMTLEGLRVAQERYLERLLSFIPDGARSVLDVGCGAGGNALALKERGYDVEGLSPDASHGERFSAATGCPFHLERFEDFRPERRFDLVFMSESAQYVPLAQLFPSIQSALAPGGSVLSSDYFVLQRDDSYICRSGHVLDDFLAAAEASGFKIEIEQDITEQVAPSLDLACGILEQYFIPSVRLALLRGAQKKPFWARTLARFFGKKLRKVDQRLENLDSDLFREKKRYMIYRLRAGGAVG